MRLKCYGHNNTPEMDDLAQNVKVMLNGEEFEDVVEVDTRKGYAKHYGKDSKGHYIMKNGDIKIYRTKGKFKLLDTRTGEYVA